MFACETLRVPESFDLDKKTREKIFCKNLDRINDRKRVP